MCIRDRGPFFYHISLISTILPVASQSRLDNAVHKIILGILSIKNLSEVVQFLNVLVLIEVGDLVLLLEHFELY